MASSRRILGPLVAALILPIATDSLAAEFVVLGDMPYGSGQVAKLDVIGAKIRERGFPFAIHYGDVKGGGAPCDLIPARRDLIYGLIPGHVFYTPGDNDWTDCDRPGAGGYDELARLDLLRRIFFSQALPAEPEWRIARQTPDYPENARWVYGGLQFVTLHIVGTDNGRQEILKSDVARALDAVDARDRANLTWLDAAFDDAAEDGADGLVAVIHADPSDFRHRRYRDRPCTRDERTRCNPYLGFVQRLRERAARLDKPVLLVHGSTSAYCLDAEFGGALAPKLWRLNGPGDFAVIDAAVVEFDAKRGRPFEIRGLMSERPVSPCPATGPPG